jgi:hypothetical protein
MRIEPGEYEIVVLDCEGFDIHRIVDSPLRIAKERAKRHLNDPEYVTGVGKVEVRNYNGECVADYFPENHL